MSDPIIIIENTQPNLVLVDESVVNNTSDYSVVIENSDSYSLSIETSFVENIGLVEIERFASSNIDILGPSAIINVSDLPDIPFSKITGSLSVARISDLDDYLNSYAFDCGTP